MTKLLITFLFLFGLGINASAQNVINEFNKAVALNDFRTVKRLIGRGVDPNTPDDKGDPAIISSAREGHAEMVQALVEGRAKLEIRNQFGDTAMMLAAINGHLKIVKYLRDKNAEINMEGWTPLAYAATNGHTSVVTYLLDQGANPNAKSPNGTSALMMSIRGLFDEASKKLMEYGADIHAENENGETALSWAVRAENEDMIKYLKKIGAKK